MGVNVLNVTEELIYLFDICFNQNYMIKKGSKLYSIFTNSCPVCHKGEFFKGRPYKGSVRHHCEYCQAKFQKEPAFYQGSYFVAYGLGVMSILASIVGCFVLLPAPDPDYIFAITALVNIFFAPFLYPMSKIIWANMFFSYNKDAVKE